MGYHTEINTLVRLPKNFDISTLKISQRIIILAERERVVPLHIALLMIDKGWNFHGYCRVNSIEIADGKSKLEVEVLTVFDEDTKRLYSSKFAEAAQITGEIK